MSRSPVTPTGTRPDPLRLRMVAHRLRVLAHQARLDARRMAVFHRPDVWSGRRADRFGQELDDIDRRLTGYWGVSEQLDWQARLLDERAASLEATG